jgi:hypothetical protein
MSANKQDNDRNQEKMFSYYLFRYYRYFIIYHWKVILIMRGYYVNSIQEKF